MKKMFVSIMALTIIAGGAYPISAQQRDVISIHHRNKFTLGHRQ